MILVADSGSTTTNWCLINQSGENFLFDTEGYNPYYVDQDYIVQSLNKNLPGDIKPAQITEVHFYGAGCMLDKTPVIEDALELVFRRAKVHTAMDLLAASRALLGREPGFAAILGTGTNTCIYDGNKITQNIDSLGYMLGDEGSGAAMVKKLLGDYIIGYMPEGISELFYDTFHLDKEGIFDHIYGQPFANRFCADFSKFIFEQIHLAYFDGLVRSSFNELFQNLVIRYPDYQSYSFNCVGSIGFTFKNILSEVALKFDMPMGKIIKAPIDGLVDYHLTQMFNK